MATKKKVKKPKKVTIKWLEETVKKNKAKVYFEWPSNFPANDLEGQANAFRGALERADREGRRMAMVLAPLAGPAYARPLRHYMQSGLRLVNIDEPMTTEILEETAGDQKKPPFARAGFVKLWFKQRNGLRQRRSSRIGARASRCSSSAQL